MGIKSLQHPDTYLPICLSAWRVSATLCTRTQIRHLFGAVAETWLKLREKPPHFCEDLFSLIYVWSGGRDSNSRHSAWKADALPTELPPRAELDLF